MTDKMYNDIQVLPRGSYLQIPFTLTLLDNTIIRSNEPEEVLTYSYNEIGDRFIIPWRKFKGKLRRLVMEKQRSFNIAPECSLKENLCMRCPACLLFGGTGETSQTKVSYNLLSRVMGETLISSTEVEDIFSYTANAVDEKNLKTGQALMTILAVPAGTTFSGIVTLRDPTPHLTAILVDNLERYSRLGASTREWGRSEIKIDGYILEDRESLNTYDYVKGKKKNINSLNDLQLPADMEECYRTVQEQFEEVLKDITGKQKK